MFATGIIFSTIIITLVSVWLFKLASGSVNPFRLNTVSYAMYFQVLTVGVVAPVLLLLGNLDYHYMAKPISEDVKIWTWVWSMYALMSLPIGMLIWNKLLGIDIRRKLENYTERKVSSWDANPGALVILALLTLSLMGLIYILFYSPSIPLLELFRTWDLQKASVQRVSSKMAFGGISYVRTFLGTLLIPAVTYYAYILVVIKRNKTHMIFFIAQLIMTFILLSFDLQKAPIAFFLIGFLVVHTFTTNGIPIKWFLLFFGGAIALLLIGYQMTTDTTAIKQLTNFNSAFYGRIFVSSFLGFPLSLELFPDVINANTALFGIPQPILSSLNLTASDSARELMKIINPNGVVNGSANLLSGYYLGEAWASFGVLGLLLAPFVVGVNIQFIHTLLLLNQKQPLYIAFYALITTKWLIPSGFSQFYTFKIILFPILLLIALFIFTNSLRRLTLDK